jgi:hypothetical protein
MNEWVIKFKNMRIITDIGLGALVNVNRMSGGYTDSLG